ncbi:uncharacterized protein EV422DRAFT_346140 [Fimicolochytrium jonesii]|uniref:uncharacterized protein n=1 Tax=Fimicolochytrium jonesii TaxID=1396493 RepID=UPI0022FEF2FA|nr:uncharacterized protein EV422DRAFT_346140 [Fimicolochytrium jonesii]KAI8815714.1 hypothetical protein EV422DRAFT_346140 [Fimicolochytrium jonesii]
MTVEGPKRTTLFTFPRVGRPAVAVSDFGELEAFRARLTETASASKNATLQQINTATANANGTTSRLVSSPLENGTINSASDGQSPMLAIRPGSEVYIEGSESEREASSTSSFFSRTRSHEQGRKRGRRSRAELDSYSQSAQLQKGLLFKADLIPEVPYSLPQHEVALAELGAILSDVGLPGWGQDGDYSDLPFRKGSSQPLPDSIQRSGFEYTLFTKDILRDENHDYLSDLPFLERDESITSLSDIDDNYQKLQDKEAKNAKDAASATDSGKETHKTETITAQSDSSDPLKDDTISPSTAPAVPSSVDDMEVSTLDPMDLKSVSSMEGILKQLSQASHVAIDFDYSSSDESDESDDSGDDVVYVSVSGSTINAPAHEGQQTDTQSTAASETPSMYAATEDLEEMDPFEAIDEALMEGIPLGELEDEPADGSEEPELDVPTKPAENSEDEESVDMETDEDAGFDDADLLPKPFKTNAAASMPPTHQPEKGISPNEMPPGSPVTNGLTTKDTASVSSARPSFLKSGTLGNASRDIKVNGHSTMTTSKFEWSWRL